MKQEKGVKVLLIQSPVTWEQPENASFESSIAVLPLMCSQQYGGLPDQPDTAGASSLAVQFGRWMMAEAAS